MHTFGLPHAWCRYLCNYWSKGSRHTFFFLENWIFFSLKAWYSGHESCILYCTVNLRTPEENLHTFSILTSTNLSLSMSLCASCPTLLMKIFHPWPLSFSNTITTIILMLLVLGTSSTFPIQVFCLPFPPSLMRKEHEINLIEEFLKHLKTTTEQRIAILHERQEAGETLSSTDKTWLENEDNLMT